MYYELLVSFILVIIVILTYYDILQLNLSVVLVSILAVTMSSSNQNIIKGGREDTYPFKKTFYPADSPTKMMDNLSAVVPNVSNNPCYPHNIKFKSNLIDTRCKVTFTHEDSDYEKFDVMGDLFTEEQRLSAKLTYRDKTPLEEWFVNKHKYKGSAMEIREQLYKEIPEATQFKPSLMVQVIKYLFPDTSINILDISAGWGDRLLAAIALNANLYSAFDPNLNLKQGHDDIINYFKVDKSKFNIEYIPFENATLNNTYDIIFSSPPFYDFEIYDKNSNGQSVKTYPELNLWLEKFLFISLKKAWESLKDNGYCVIHLSDSYNIKICEPMCLYILGYLGGSHYIGCYCSVGKAGKPRPMWVFQKKKENNNITNKAKNALSTIFKL